MTTVDPYRGKLRSPHDAVGLVVDGDHIAVPTALGEPPALLEALSDRRAEWRDVVVHHNLCLRPFDYFDAVTAENVRPSALFIGAPSRPGVRDGWADWIPNSFAELPQLMRSGRIPVDVLFTMAAPIDDDGRLSLGLAPDYALAAAEVARTIVVEVNPRVPYTYGNCFVHIDQVDAVVVDDRPLTQLQPKPAGEVEHAIGSFVADLIPDGAALQIGIGAIPEVVVSQLAQRRDLGIHTEMMGDGLWRLIESGAVTNRYTQEFPGVGVATFALGTSGLYEWMDHNRQLEMHPVDVTNDPYLAGRNQRLHTINSAVEMDLIGQVCSESIGALPYSGAGGQLDFVRAGNRSPGGRSFIVATSTAKNGTVSRIVPQLKPGSVVTTGKNDVDYVVTEYGVAQLRGKSVSQRATELISIAHPDFRAELREHAARYLRLADR